MDCSLPGSSVHGILQARTPGWVAMRSPRGSSRHGMEPTSLRSPALAGRFFTSSTPWEAPREYMVGLLRNLFWNQFMWVDFQCYKLPLSLFLQVFSSVKCWNLDKMLCLLPTLKFKASGFWKARPTRVSPRLTPHLTPAGDPVHAQPPELVPGPSPAAPPRHPVTHSPPELPERTRSGRPSPLSSEGGHTLG